MSPRRFGRDTWILVVALLTVSFCMLSGSASATPRAVSIPPGGRAGDRAEIFVDEDGRRTAAEVARSNGFSRLERTNFGHTPVVIWLKLAIDNPGDTAESAIIELAATAAHADLHEADGTWLESSGSDLQFTARSVDYSNIAFRVSIPARQSRTLLVRISSRDTMIVDPVIWRERVFWSAVERRKLLDGIYYGIILGLALYNLFLAFATRERAYLAYVLFQLMMAATNAAVDKYTFQFFWPAHPFWATRSEQFFGMGAVAAAMGCARLLLETKRYAPRVDRLLGLLGILSLVASVVAASHDASPLELASMTSVAFAGIVMLVVAAAIVSRGGNPQGRIFLAAWSLLLLGVVSANLFASGLIQSLVGYDMLKLGSAAEAIVLSLGLAARIRTLHEARERAQSEVLVERTRRVEALSLLVSGVAHEIGNPLNFAQGGAEALKELVREPDAVGALALVEGGLVRIRRLVESLRVDLGERAYARDVGEVDVRDELEEALAVLAPVFAARSIDVRCSERAGRLAARARPGELGQVFGNLARNAADAMPNGGALSISTSVDPTSNEVSVVFEDEGEGVPDDIRSRIFEPFFTGRASGALGPGVGLGLFIAVEVARRCGGTVSLGARGERGASFVVRLPLASGASAPLR